MKDLDNFLSFVVERHKIWEKRQAGMPQPWTSDPVLSCRKMTNVFRILDPGTQFVMTDLLEPGLPERDQLMRLFLYRHTGRVETWQYLDLVGLGYPTVENLEDAWTAWQDYRGKGVYKLQNKKPYSERMNKAGGFGSTTYERTMFTSAYLVFPQSQTPGTDKLRSILDLAARLFTPGSPDDVMPRWERARTQAQRFKVLRDAKGVGDFMSMQVLTDWGYQHDVDREDEFLQPGPGSVKGAAALDPSAKPMEVVARVVEAVRGLPDCPRLGYRVPSLMDIGSNLLCEWSKYSRYREKPVPVKTYTPAHPGPQPEPVLPRYYTEDLL